jgi:hypothetical protein
MVIRSLLPVSMETTHYPKEAVLLIALKIMRHAKLCLSVIMFLINLAKWVLATFFLIFLLRSWVCRVHNRLYCLLHEMHSYTRSLTEQVTQ